MPQLEPAGLALQNRRLRLTAAACLGLTAVTLLSGQVVAPQNESQDTYHAAVPVDSADGFVVLVRNDGRVYRVGRHGDAERLNPR
ncbi:MAG: hypothetical protein AAF333_16860 [Planctomycetota bacterium]